MWYLTNLHTGKVFFLKLKKTTIGRKGSEIELENDQSLSRIHAYFILEGDVLKVQDAKSKYGTFLNDKKADNEKLQPELEVELNDGDSVLFGKFNNEWTVHKLEFKTATSMLDQEKSDKLNKILTALVIPIAKEFDASCTHLTMPMQTSVSHKLLQALTMCKPIVNPKFWVAVQDSYAKNQPLPKYLDFVPKVKEETFITPDTVSLAMNDKRRTIFTGKTFIFMSSTQLKIYENVITSGGGKCLTVSKDKVTMVQCCAKNSVVIQCKDDATQSINDTTIEKIRGALNNKKRRMIPEMEIGTAVLHATTERWCNPEQSAMTSLIIREVPSSSQLRITKSITLAQGSMHSSDSMGPPPPKRPRGRPPKVIEIVNLDSDEEDEIVEGNNKENVPEVSIELPETQISVDEELPVTQASDLPETQDSFVSAVSRNEISVDAEEVSNKRKTRLASKSPEIASTSSKSPEIASTSSKSPEKASTSTNKSFSNVSIASAPMSNVDLFNFSSASSFNRSSKDLRKRKISENIEAVASTSKKDADPKPAAKKSRIVDSDDEDFPPPPPVQKSATRKRAADKDVGGLFSFNNNFAKRQKPAEATQEPIGPSGIIAYTPKPVEQTPVKRFCDDSDDSCDSGVWLSKAMFSVNLKDSADGIVKTEPDSSLNTEDIKPSSYATLFSILETSSAPNSTTSSTVSKRKQFVKKLNFKRQSSVVTMKVYSVEKTIMPLDDF